MTFSLPHIANKDAILNDYVIPKGSIIIANLYSAHIDPKYWPEPEKFSPERFLSPEGKLIRKTGLVPFGDGEFKVKAKPISPPLQAMHVQHTTFSYSGKRLESYP